jgi:hypothetical protein
VSHHPIQGQDGHGALKSGSTLGSSLANKMQLDAGMHPAHEGLSAMPFYDEFDLSTVDVLLISQYVYVHSGRHFYRGGRALAHRCSRRRISRELCPLQHLVYQNQWNIICILFSDSMMCHYPSPSTCT